jgi:hypothetical protein
VTARLYLDEHVDIAIAALLRNDSRFDILTTKEAGRANQSLSDEDQLRCAAAVARAILTYNIKDFAPLAVKLNAEGFHHKGIIWSEEAPAYQLAARLRQLGCQTPPTGYSTTCK